MAHSLPFHATANYRKEFVKVPPSYWRRQERSVHRFSLWFSVSSLLYTQNMNFSINMIIKSMRYKSCCIKWLKGSAPSMPSSWEKLTTEFQISRFLEVFHTNEYIIDVSAVDTNSVSPVSLKMVSSSVLVQTLAKRTSSRDPHDYSANLRLSAFPREDHKSNTLDNKHKAYWWCHKLGSQAIFL